MKIFTLSIIIILTSFDHGSFFTNNEKAIETMVIYANHIESSLVIDGELSENAWNNVKPISGFIQYIPNPGEPASQQTEVRILYDEKNLYIEMRMYEESNDDIIAQLGRKDDPDLMSDWATVMIDSDLDRRNAFYFQINPLGGRREGLVVGDNEYDDNWKGVWQGAAVIDSLGWTAEFKIPFSQLNFSYDGRAEFEMGINFGRDIVRKNEVSVWAPTDPRSNRIVSSFGIIKEINLENPPKGLEIIPYVSTQIETVPEAGQNSLINSPNFGFTGGIDVRYGFGNGFTLAGTLNPDFGQVEVDPAVVNLTEFEVFFPERRPFFLEGSTVYQYGRTPNVLRAKRTLTLQGEEGLLYTRRIGSAPAGVPTELVNELFIPGNTRILSAAKIVGRTSNGLSVGVLNALSERTIGKYVNLEGEVGCFTAEPFTSYSAARISRDYDRGSSSIGAIITATNRESVLDNVSFHPDQSYGFGIDARHRFGGNDYEVAGWLSGSHVSGDQVVISNLQRQAGRYFQRPDANHLVYNSDRTSLTGLAGSTGIGKSGGNWRGGLQIETRSPEYEINDLGYLRDTDWNMIGTWLGYVTFNPHPKIRQMQLYGNTYIEWDWGGERLGTALNLSYILDLQTNWLFSGGSEYHFRGMDVDVLRGGPGVVTNPVLLKWGNIFTDRRKPVNMIISYILEVEPETNGYDYTIASQINFYPNNWMNYSIRPLINTIRNPWQWVDVQMINEEVKEYIVGKVKQTTIGVNFRASVTPIPDLSFDLFVQPLVGRAEYSDFRFLSNPRSTDFNERFESYSENALQHAGETDQGQVEYRVIDDDKNELYTFTSPSFSIQSLRFNTVMRWEYRPGSEIFLVWQQSRHLHETRFDRILGNLFTDINSISPHGIFLVKATFWFAT